MGSILSGRRGGKPLVEDCLTLDLAWLMRAGPIRDGQSGSGQVNWSAEGAAIGSLRFRLDFQEPGTARLVLHYSLGQSKPVRQSIALTATGQHFGGRRWWMLCPVTDRRVRTLHLLPGGTRFASREAWGLAYRVERLDRFDRAFEKLFRAQRRLGGVQGLYMGLERPKGMWRRTYDRHLATFEALDVACAKKIVGLIGGNGVSA